MFWITIYYKFIQVSISYVFNVMFSAMVWAIWPGLTGCLYNYGRLISLNAMAHVAEGPFQRNAMYFLKKIIIYLEASETD